MLLKICLISALVVAFEASPFVGQEELEVDRVRIQAAASAPAASPQMDVWRAEERQGWRYDCCELDELDHGSECSLKVGYKNCRKHEEFYKCRISKSRSRCVLKEMTKKEKEDQKKEKADQKKEKADQKKKKADQKKEKADQKFNPDKCCILSERNECMRLRNCSDYKCSLSKNPNPKSGERYMCVPEKMTEKEKADQEKEKAEREWGKTCCSSRWSFGGFGANKANQHWMCNDRTSFPSSKIEEKCMLRVCIKPEDGKCLGQLKTDYNN